VQQLKAHTVGGIVPAAETLMLIVPTSDRIEVEAILDNRDVGFVQPGQRAAVKLDAFDYTRFGVVPGQVVQVSADSLEDRNRGLVYTVKVLLDQKAVRVQDRELPIGTGMSVNVEIKTGERRVIEYLLSPLLQHRREALRER
jgi:hemolysin D